MSYFLLSYVNLFLFSFSSSAALWTKYGTLKGDTTLVIVNSVGVVLNLVYMSVYYIYTVYKVRSSLNIFFVLAICPPLLVFLLSKQLTSVTGTVGIIFLKFSFAYLYHERKLPEIVLSLYSTATQNHLHVSVCFDMFFIPTSH